jgi:hypothetical protein
MKLFIHTFKKFIDLISLTKNKQLFLIYSSKKYLIDESFQFRNRI